MKLETKLTPPYEKGIRPIPVKKPPRCEKAPPLFSPDLKQGGGFFTFARKFRKFEDFSLRKSLENGVLQEKNVFRALQTVKIFACGGQTAEKTQFELFVNV